MMCKCNRCGHVWESKNNKPVACARCKSAYWNVPKKVNMDIDDITQVLFNRKK